MQDGQGETSLCFVPDLVTNDACLELECGISPYGDHQPFGGLRENDARVLPSNQCRVFADSPSRPSFLTTGVSIFTSVWTKSPGRRGGQGRTGAGMECLRTCAGGTYRWMYSCRIFSRRRAPGVWFRRWDFEARECPTWC